jgi:Flp pilus assembly CpaE family ATPase
VAGGAGSPGRTTVALNLAVALGAAAPTAMVELDLCAPAAAAYLDADPSRNVCTLAHAVRDDPRVWSAALADELQPLHSCSPHASLLCGPPKREMRTSVGPAFVEQLIDEVAQRYRWVILDVGGELLGMDIAAATHRAALCRAEHVLLVTAPDLLGLWHARTALDQFERLLGLERRRVNLVLNRYDLRFHHSRQEIEWHLGAPVVGVIPFDHTGQQRAMSEQRPLVVDGSSRAGRALLHLAERLNDAKLRLPAPADVGVSPRPWWRRLLRRPPASPPTRATLRRATSRAGAVSRSRTRTW